MGIIWGKEREGGYVPSWWHRRMKPGISGNEINGLGEREKRRPTPMGTPLNMVHAAERAGMGQLGKHGSLIHKTLGPMFRMAYVLTDLPLVVDGPEDIAVDDFCRLCKLCTTACPPGAIFSEKQWVRGDLKWYVDFDKCVPYFNENMGCGICLAVCPYSQPGVSEKLVFKMLRRREREGEKEV